MKVIMRAASLLWKDQLINGLVKYFDICFIVHVVKPPQLFSLQMSIKRYVENT